MELTRLRLLAAALALGLAQGATARHQHNAHLHRLFKAHQDLEEEHNVTIAARGSGSGKKCTFPSDDGDLVAVAAGMKNAGWAIAPDIECVAGMYCPYACAPGKVMAQWKEGSKYTYPESMDGGMYCDDDGVPHKPFPNKPYCVDGTGTVQAVNEAGKGLSFCQTTLPGDESMVIPTYVGAGSSVTLAVPDTSYWCETAAHYYINPPGVGVEGCVWGVKTKTIGNWTPFVAGANTDAKGQTFVKIGWNPVFFEEPALMASVPTFGVKIECDSDAGCNGLPCTIDPSKGKLNSVESNNAASGAGGGDFCVVTVPKGKKSRIVVFDTAGGSSGSSGGDTPTSTKAPEPATTSKASSPPKTSQFAAAAVPTTTTTRDDNEEPARPTTVQINVSASVSLGRPSITPGVFHENSSNGTNSEDSPSSDSDGHTSAQDTPTSAPSSDDTSAAPTASSDEGVGSRPQGSAAAGLLVAFVALLYLL